MNGFLLAAGMGDFLTEWYGVLIFVLLDVLIACLIVAVTYRVFFKYALDFLCGLVAAAVTSPVWLTVTVLSYMHMIKTNADKSVFARRYIAGKNGRKIALHAFTVRGDLDGEYTRLGEFLHRTGIEKLPAVFDLLTLRMSLVGVTPLSPVDEKFVGEEDYARFSVRPGFVRPPVRTAARGGEVTYEDLFRAEKEYAAKYGFFTDVGILWGLFLRLIRGEKRKNTGETSEMSYAAALLARGEITAEDYAAALAEEGIEPPAAEPAPAGEGSPAAEQGPEPSATEEESRADE